MILEICQFPVPFKRIQFPALGAYYMTINQARGQTLLRGGLFLETSVLSHGHLYVPFGRCGDPHIFVCIQIGRSLQTQRITLMVERFMLEMCLLRTHAGVNN